MRTDLNGRRNGIPVDSISTIPIEIGIPTSRKIEFMTSSKICWKIRMKKYGENYGGQNVRVFSTPRVASRSPSNRECKFCVETDLGHMTWSSA
jgi:hypothetical protein